MKLSMILAMDRNGLIGKDNGLPWSHSEDLKFFKKMTVGKTVIMGRKTFDSIGKALPNRNNVVISTKFIEAENIASGGTWDDAKHLADMIAPGVDAVVIGGKQLYESVMDEVEEIYVTLIDNTHEGDTYLEHELFRKLKDINLDPTNPISALYGHEHIYLTYDDENPTRGARPYAWSATVIDRVLSNDVMLNFIKLTRCI